MNTRSGQACSQRKAQSMSVFGSNMVFIPPFSDSIGEPGYLLSLLQDGGNVALGIALPHCSIRNAVV